MKGAVSGVAAPQADRAADLKETSMTFAYIANPPSAPHDLHDLCTLVGACSLVPVLPATAPTDIQPDPRLFSVRALQIASCSTIVVDLRGDIGVSAAWRRELISVLTERDRVCALLAAHATNDNPVVRVVYTDHYMDLDVVGATDADMLRSVPTCGIIDYTQLPLLWMCCDAVHAAWASRGQLSIFAESDWSEDVWSMYVRLRQGTLLRSPIV